MKPTEVALITDSLPFGGKKTYIIQIIKEIDPNILSIHLIVQTGTGELLEIAKKAAPKYYF